jgi:DNA-binding NtrC family response regulator
MLTGLPTLGAAEIAVPSPFDVLVADDDPAVRELLAEFFRSRGLDVTTASDGRAAVTELQRSGGRYGLVVTDIAMPGADGFAVLSAARDANPSAYVVVVTGYASLDSAINAVRTGAGDYLVKPFALGELDVVLRQARTRVALEAERRRSNHGAIAAALAAIDSRLTAIEHTLADLRSAITTRR